MRVHPGVVRGGYDLARVQRDLRPCLRHVPSQDASLGASRLGGDPDVPSNSAWPTASGGELMHFVGQLNFATRPDLPGDERPLLPWSGLLSVFDSIGDASLGWTPDHAAGSHVIFTPTGVPLVRRASPPSLDPGPYDPQPFRLAVGVSVGSVSAAETVAGGPSIEQELDWKAHLDFMDFESEPTPHHQVLGNAHGMGDEGVPHRQVGSDLFDIPGWERRWGEVPGSLDDWACVWTIDSDDESGMSFGDWGRLLICVPRVDLRRSDFRRVVALNAEGG